MNASNRSASPSVGLAAVSVRFLALAVILSLLCARLEAQYKLCFPSTTWFGGASGPDFNNFKVNDPLQPGQAPGWLGAFRYVFGNGTTSPYAVVQGIRDSSNNLFLSLEAEGMTTLESSTVVVLGLDFRQTPTQTGPLFEIVLHPVFSPPALSTLPSSSASAVGPTSGGNTSGVKSFYSGTADMNTGVATWTQQIPTPTWLNTVPVTGAPNNQVGYWGTSGNYHWFLETEIPSANLPVPTSGFFGLYVNIFRVVGTKYAESWWPPTTGLYEPGCPCPPGSTNTQCNVGSSCSPGAQIPDPGIFMTAYNWGQSTIDTAQSCGGVSVGSQINDIYTNNFPKSLICLQNNVGLNCSSPTPNIFTAKVTNTTVNGSGTPQPAPNVQATFSIANFGLQNPWDPLQWTQIGKGNSPANPTNNPTSPITLTANSTTSLSTGSWFPVQPNASLYDPTTGHPHQCILVTLDSTSGNVDFINNSAIQNMDFVNTSKFERTAEISAKGYPPRYNPDGTPASDQIFDLHLITSHEVLGQGQATSASYSAQAGPVQVTERGKVTSQFTWIAQGCRHTGRFMTVDDRKIELCDPVGGFGYVMRHAGATAVRDWKIKFTGLGLKPVPGQDNTYQIHIPQGGVATVTTYADPQGEGTGKFALFLDAGGNIPHGTFGTAFNKGFSLNAGLEYIATSHFSVEGIFGYHHFPSSLFGDLNVYQFSVNGKTYLTNGTIRPFVNGGVGGYKFSPGSTYFGGNFGGGVLFNLTSRFGLQGSYNFHVVDTAGAATKWSDAQAGVEVRF